MSDCVEGGRSDDARGVGAIEEETMVGGASGSISAHCISCGANSSQGTGMGLQVGPVVLPTNRDRRTVAA